MAIFDKCGFNIESISEVIKPIMQPLEDRIHELETKLEQMCRLLEQSINSQIPQSVLNEKNSVIERQEKEILESKGKIDILSIDNTKMKENMNELEKQLTDLQQEKQELRLHLENVQAEKVESDSQIQGLIKTREEVERKLSETNELREKLANNNKSMIENAVDMIKDYDQGLDKIPEECREFASNVIDRLHDMLLSGGLAPIEGENEFDSIRHQAVPRRVIPDGVKIIQTIQPGLCLGKKVYVRAKVEIETMEDKQ